MNAITAPVLGLMVYNTDLNCLHFYFGSWKSQCDPANLGAWSILGNNNITDGTHFLGTTNNVPLSFRVNNQRSGYIDNSAAQSTFFGYRAGLNTISPATNSTAFGFDALRANTTGVSNTAVGSLALRASTTGQANTAIGYLTLGNATAATFNVAIGDQAMSSATGGSYNTVVGGSALQNNTTGINNTALGLFTLQTNTTGQYNVAVGSHTLIGNTIGSGNIGMGHYTLRNNTSGEYNVGIGRGALEGATTANNNVAIGYFAMANAATTGNSNVGIGEYAMYRNTTGFDNVGIGRTTLSYNSTGQNNVGIGTGAVYSNTTGSNNVGMGANALNAAVTVSNNTAIGAGAAQYTTGANNTSLGYNALNLNTSGANNVAIGHGAGTTNTTGNNNTLLGYNTNVSGVGFTNATAIGANAVVGASNSLVLGNLVNVGINTTAPQYKLDIDAQTGSAGNPLRLLGLNAGATSDSIISSNSGILRRLSVNQIIGNAWNITGNAGTVDGTNFIGTTDNVPFNIRVNNQKAGRIDATNNNAFFGYLAGNVTTANKNAAFGDQALTLNTTGFSNAAFGAFALNANTTGYVNSAFGQEAMTANTTGKQNAAFGFQSLKVNTTGDNNNGFGYQSLMGNTSGTGNNAFGYQNLVNNLTGNYNTSVGHATLYTNSTGSYNVAVGSGSLFYNTSGQNNSALGAEVLNANTTGQNNVGTGHRALYTNTTGSNNTASGINSLALATTAWSNTALGYSAAYNTTGSKNVAVGDSAMFLNTTGINNTTLGYAAGSVNTTGSNNTLLGANANVATAALSNATAIGANATVGASNSLVLGNLVNVGINTTAPQYKLDIDAQTGSAGNPLRLLGLNAGATSDSIISSNSGLLRRLSINQILGNAWQLGGNAVTSVQNIGTTANYALPFITNNLERARITEGGNVGIGMTSPAARLHIVSGVDATLGLGPSGDFIIGSTTGSNLVMDGNEIMARSNGSTSIFYLQSEGGDLQIHNQGVSGTEFVIKDDGKVGIGSLSPQYKLDVDAMIGSAGNPLRLKGLLQGASTDSMLTSLNGVVRQIPVSLLTTRFRNDFWAKDGNGGTDPATNFAGTTDAVGFAIRTDNTERMRVDETGKLGVNTTTPNSSVQINGSFATALTTKTGAYTATVADHIIIGNAATAAFTITLPTAIGIAGRQYIVKKTDATANAVTVATTGGQTIDGATTVTVSIQWQTKTFVSDGANWLIISNQ